MTTILGLTTEYLEADFDGDNHYLGFDFDTTTDESGKAKLKEVRNWITANATKLTVASGTLTASAPVSITQTWNEGSTAFTGVDVNITDTASASTSLVQNWRKNGTSVVALKKSGRLQFKQGLNGLFIENEFNDYGLGYNSNGELAAVVNAGCRTIIGYNVITAGYLGLSPSAGYSMSPDVIIHRDAAATLALRNSTNAQTFRVYGSYTDASNYSRASLSATTSVVTLAAETAGTFSANDVDLALTPKNSGAVRFGTHSTLSGETVTGYITVKDSSGTTRKLAVVS